ncbi:MAG: VIT1/CCC1 family protein [Synergistaceae bacterium]|jgi:VIT1/CCC1 family predicted Fe2+/Mn2+ transporter|nr:VIT1/CCC1 family protein [Synergistaceae bacterium]
MKDELNGTGGGNLLRLLLEFQQAEVDGAALYRKIASRVPDEKNRRIILLIADDEAKHASAMCSYTRKELQPNRLKVMVYAVTNFFLGYTFTIKLMERSEVDIKSRYNEMEDVALAEASPDVAAAIERILSDEERHENILLDMLKEERVSYIGSTVLGMNDALVELSGALAGYTLAMKDTKLISMAGLITGFSATLSMAASGYLSARAAGDKNAVKASIYTGIAYLLTIALLILPYLLAGRDEYIGALLCTMAIAIGIIAYLNWYISVALDRSFKSGFMMMASLSVGVALLSFILGMAVKNLLGIEL